MSPTPSSRRWKRAELLHSGATSEEWILRIVVAGRRRMSRRHERIDELFVGVAPRGSDCIDVLLPLLERARPGDHGAHDAIRPSPRQREFHRTAAAPLGLPL